VPLMRDLPTAVRLLVERSADQAAAAHCGREPLRSALLSTQAVDGPRRALPMAGGDTAIRLHRLDTASPAGRRPATALEAVAGGFAAFGDRRGPGRGRQSPRLSLSGQARDEREVKPRRRRLLPTTNTELNAIAAPAIIGFSNPAAASGSAARL
jgi:hypothetical protein